MAKRTTSPQLGAVAGREREAEDGHRALPASAVPTTQGSASANATTTDWTATTRTRPSAPRAPTRTDPTTQATAVTRTMGTIAGAKPAAAAMTAPRMTTWPTGRLRQCGPGSTA